MGEGIVHTYSELGTRFRKVSLGNRVLESLRYLHICLDYTFHEYRIVLTDKHILLPRGLKSAPAVAERYMVAVAVTSSLTSAHHSGMPVVPSSPTPSLTGMAALRI